MTGLRRCALGRIARRVAGDHRARAVNPTAGARGTLRIGIGDEHAPPLPERASLDELARLLVGARPALFAVGLRRRGTRRPAATLPEATVTASLAALALLTIGDIGDSAASDATKRALADVPALPLLRTQLAGSTRGVVQRDAEALSGRLAIASSTASVGALAAVALDLGFGPTRAKLRRKAGIAISTPLGRGAVLIAPRVAAPRTIAGLGEAYAALAEGLAAVTHRAPTCRPRLDDPATAEKEGRGSESPGDRSEHGHTLTKTKRVGWGCIKSPIRCPCAARPQTSPRARAPTGAGRTARSRAARPRTKAQPRSRRSDTPLRRRTWPRG